MNSDTLCIIPCYNESLNLKSLIEDLASNKADIDFDLIFIDDCSSDSTVEIIKNRNFTLVSHAFNLGYGASVKTGLSYALERNYKYMVLFPGDHQRSFDDVILMHNFITKNKLDVVVGSKFHIYSERYGPIGRRFGNRFFSFLARNLWNSPVVDVLSGFKFYRVEAVRDFYHLLPNNYSFDIVFSFFASKNSLLQGEVPVKCRYDSLTSKMRNVYIVSLKMLFSVMCAYWKYSNYAKTSARLNQYLSKKKNQ